MLYYYANEQKTPDLRSLLILAEIASIPEEKLHESIQGFYTPGNQVHTLPKTMTKDLAYLIGALAGDGHVNKISGVEITNESHEYLCEVVAPIAKSLFDVEPSILEAAGCWRLYVHSAPVRSFLSRVIGLPIGEKKGNLIVPPLVMTDGSYMRGFLQGLFDTDGGITKSDSSVSVLFSASTLPFLLEVQKMLADLNLVFPGPYCSGNRKGWEIRSFKRGAVTTLKNTIGFVHPDKIARHASVAQR